MKENVNLNRNVFDKGKFEQTVDTSFNQLGVVSPTQTFFSIDLATVEDFFALYEKLFYQIPREGDTDSHTYLIIESTEYVGDEQINLDIQALLNEIARLRTDLLAANKQIIDLQTTAAQNIQEDDQILGA